MAVQIVVEAVRQRMSAMSHDPSDAIDEDHDGKISVKELIRALRKVHVRGDHMLEVLQLEQDLMEMVLKLPNFLVCLFCFLIALMRFSPPVHVNNIHQRLTSHFELEEVPLITNFSTVYNFMERFEHHNEELQATSFRYWCERRYARHSWNEHLLVPVHECASPRLFALQLVTDSSFKWKPNSSSSGSGSSSGSSSAGAHTSSATSKLEMASDRSYPLYPDPPCQDNEAMLRQQFGSLNATCIDWALDPQHHVCEDKQGLTMCAQTCGFCSPFDYDHLRRFERPMVTMLPVMVYQTRYAKADCHGFAHTYETQPYNPALIVMPALDGARNDQVLTCIDRTKSQESEFALLLDCPPGTPPSLCHDNKMGFTRKHTFHGDVIYPALLIEPHRDIQRMKDIEWVDLQTDTVSLSTVIYTEGVEIFTSLTVNFEMDEAGNLDGKVIMISYRDLVGSTKVTFVACLCTCIIGAFVGVGLSIYTILRFPTEGKRVQLGYELASRLLLMIYPLVLVIQWSMQIPMSVEFDVLLHSFLDLRSIADENLEAGIQNYFDTKTIIWEETQWLNRHRIAAYVICYIQFLQLVFYFNAHPKMAVLTTTVQRAMDNIGHFLVLFMTLFCMLALVAHWILGPYLQALGTMSEALKTQVQMLYGDFIQIDKVEENLNPQMVLVYWVYAGTFMLLCIWVLMNFFLAIIVDAFVEVKDTNARKVAARDFFTDCIGVFWTRFLAFRKGWPSRVKLIRYFKEQIYLAEEAQRNTSRSTRTAFLDELQTAGEKGPGHSHNEEHQAVFIETEDIMKQFQALDDREALAVFLLHYYNKCRPVLALKTAPTSRTSPRTELSTHQSFASESGAVGRMSEAPRSEAGGGSAAPLVS